MDTEMCESEN